MGRGRGGKWNKNRSKGGDGGRKWSQRGGQRARSNYDDIVKSNERFERYYNELGIVPESEREAFWGAMRRELPNSFRFAGSRGHALAVQQRLIDHYIPEITSVEYEGQKVEPPFPIPWYPERLAWMMTTPKNVVRKFPPFASFQKFLVSETSVGNISRQEVVSMIPPLLLDVRPGMTVLDMCAAPGSKSSQLIELIHGGEEARVRKIARQVVQEQGRELSPDGFEVDVEKEQADAEDDWSDDGRATGLLIANDADYKRAQLLVHQVKRLNSANMVVMNHDATAFPSIKLPSAEGQASNRYLKFDRILADVPCSGDGTARKNYNVWKDWIAGNGIGLHTVQVRILVRALQMLKVGGRVVYSTCSMNPVENEAVVAAAIDRCGGSQKVKLVDASGELPGLKRRPGLSAWKVMDKGSKIWNSWEEVEAESVEDDKNKVIRTMFPPSEEDEKLPLENCIRVYPHLQDTGAFFIAVLEKQSEIRARPEGEAKTPNGAEKKVTEPAKDAVTQPVATTNLPGIMDVVHEIESRPQADDPILDHLKSADAIAPPIYDHDSLMDQGNAPAAARQNAEAIAGQGPIKRPLEDDGVGPDAKKVKTQDGEETAPSVETERLVHWPPPPAAELDKTAVTHNNNHAPKQNPYSDPEPPKRRNNQQFEEPFKYLDPEHEELRKIYDFYDLSTRFPRDRFMVRNATGEPAKAIYYTSELTKDILTENEGKGMKFVHCGVKMFMKQDAQGQDTCRWRIQSDGMPIVESWIGEKRIVRLYKRSTLRKLLIEMFPKVAEDGWKELGEIGEQVKDLQMGCCVLRVEPSEGEDGFKDRIVLPLWRSIAALNLMLPKEERKAMLLRLFNDSSELIDHSKERFGKDSKQVPVQKIRANTSSPEPDDITMADINMPLKPIGAHENEMLTDDEEGGVMLKPEGAEGVDDERTAVDGSKFGMDLEERLEEVEDRALSKAWQKKHDTDTKEIAPGVTDEEDTFNKTV